MTTKLMRWWSALPLVLALTTCVGGQMPPRLPMGILPPPPPLPLPLPVPNPTNPNPKTLPMVQAPDAQYRDAVGYLGRLVADMLDLREDLAKLPPGQQRALAEPLRLATGAGEDLYRVMVRGGSPREVRGDFRRFRPAADELIGTLRQNGPLTPFGRLAGRMEYQLGRVELVVLGKNEEAEDLSRVRVARVLKEQAEQLARLGAEILPDDFKGQKLEDDLRFFSEDVDRLRRSLERGSPKDRVDQDWGYIRDTWRPAAWRLDKLRYEGRKELRDQARRVNELFIHMGRQLGYDEKGLPDFAVIAGRNQKPFYAVSAGAGLWPAVAIFDDARANVATNTLLAYDKDFKGGVRIAVADVNGDGISDIITVPGPGMVCLVRVFSGKDLTLLNQFLAYDATFKNGAYVAAADFDGDGKAEIVVGPDIHAQPVIQIFQGERGQLIKEFDAWPRGQLQGMRVAVADFTGDKVPDIAIVGGPGCNTVRIYDGSNFRMVKEFLCYPPAYTGGLYVAGGDFRGLGRADLVFGCDGDADASILFMDARTGRVYDQVRPFGAFRCGVRVGVADVNQDGILDVLTVPGPPGVPQLVVLDGATRKPIHGISATLTGDWFRGGTYTDGR